jgi:hypothetical protein
VITKVVQLEFEQQQEISEAMRVHRAMKSLTWFDLGGSD